MRIGTGIARAMTVVTALVVFLACGGGPQGAKPKPTGAATNSRAEWTTQKDAAGFSIALPPGWTAKADRSGRIDVTGANGERALIWPVFLPAAAATRSATSQSFIDRATAQSLIQSLSRKAWPDATWEQAEVRSEQVARTKGRAGNSVARALLASAASQRGIAACLYLASAPEARIAAAESTFAQVFSSFQLIGSPASPVTSSNEPRYVKFQDPQERAFTIDVPEGWKTTGGLARQSAVQVRAIIETTSPDGSIRIAGGDPGIPTFTVPNQTLEWTGFREGSWYSPGYGVRMMVMRYMPGPDYVASYVKNTVGARCADLRLGTPRPRPELSREINETYRQFSQYGAAVQMSAGDVEFTCSASGQPVRGYYLASTQYSMTGQVAIWTVESLYGYLARPDREATAQSVLAHMVESFSLSPDWLRMQQGITMSVSKIVTDTNNAISKNIKDTYESKWKTLDEIDRKRSNAILGLEDTIDSATGERRKVESGSNYYWVDVRGNVVGTDTHTLPSLDFRELIRY